VDFTYDQKTDSLTVIFKEQAQVAISDDGKRGAILDFDDAGDLVAIEILDASRRVSEARRVDFTLILSCPPTGPAQNRVPMRKP
jgi:uncharacterized protein YuzE